MHQSSDTIQTGPKSKMSKIYKESVALSYVRANMRHCGLAWVQPSFLYHYVTLCNRTRPQLTMATVAEKKTRMDYFSLL